MAGGAVAIVMIAGFLPDVTEENWYQTNQCCKGGMAGNGWWRAGVGCGGSGGLLGVEDAGVGKRNQEKLTQLPFCRPGGAEFPTY